MRVDPEWTKEDDLAVLDREIQGWEREAASLEAAIARYPNRSGSLEIRAGLVAEELELLTAKRRKLLGDV